MKYTQYSEFSSLLEKNGLTLNDWKKNPNVKLIKEEGEAQDDGSTLDTKKGNIITKRGRIRMSLNRHAKKILKSLNKDLVEKYATDMKRIKTEEYKKMAELLRQKQPKEVIKAMQKELKGISKKQSNAENVIMNSTRKTLENYGKRIKNTLEKKGLKERTLASLETYWDLLSAQIEINILNTLSKKDDAIIQEIIDDPKIQKIAREIDKKVGAGKTKAIEGKKRTIAELKPKYQNLEKEASSEDSEEEDSGSSNADSGNTKEGDSGSSNADSGDTKEESK